MRDEQHFNCAIGRRSPRTGEPGAKVAISPWEILVGLVGRHRVGRSSWKLVSTTPYVIRDDIERYAHVPFSARSGDPA